MIQQGMLLGNRYEILGILGTGGMADVYKAKDQVLDRLVAVKVLKGELCGDANLIERFRAEAKAAAGLSHPNLVRVFDVDSQAGIHYIVMELVEGVTLKKYIERKGRIPTEEAIMIVLHVLAGMEAAHRNGIIHRDIKPQNIIISMNGEVKVTDFGIARVSSNQTISINTLGSVHYSSPEQARGAHSDFRTDIYSLGVTLYEMVTGRVPFDGESTVSIALMHLQDTPVNPSVYNPTISASLEKIILKCMQKSPAARYQSTTALSSDLKMALSDSSGSFVTPAPIADATFGTTRIMADDEKKEIERGFREGGAVLSGGKPAAPVKRSDDGRTQNPKPKGAVKNAGGGQMIEADEDEGEISPKLDRIMTIGMIIIGVIIIMILAFIVLNALGIGKKKVTDTTTSSKTSSVVKEPEKTMIKVPDFTNKTMAEGLKLVNGKLTLLQAATDHSDTIEAGRIIAQSIEKDTEVEPNTEVKLTVSLGKKPEEKKTSTVPKLEGLTRDEAIQALNNAMLTVNEQEDFSDTVAAGHVISASLSNGVVVEQHTTITIVISKGKEELPIPSVHGLSVAGAKTVLEAAGFVFGGEEEKESDQEKGLIIDQTPAADTKAVKGTKVVVIVSKGPKSEVKPTPPEPTPPDQNTSSKTDVTVKVDIFAPIGYVDGDPLIVKIGDKTQTLEAPGTISVTGKKGTTITISISDGKDHGYEKEVKFE